jgi:hypothetical protein
MCAQCIDRDLQVGYDRSLRLDLAGQVSDVALERRRAWAFCVSPRIARRIDYRPPRHRGHTVTAREQDGDQAAPRDAPARHPSPAPSPGLQRGATGALWRSVGDDEENHQQDDAVRECGSEAGTAVFQAAPNGAPDYAFLLCHEDLHGVSWSQYSDRVSNEIVAALRQRMMVLRSQL